MKNKFLFIACSTLLTTFIFLGCPGSKRDELEFYRSKVDSLRNLVNAFIFDYNKLRYESYLENQPIMLSNLYQKYGQLFNQDDINLINNLLKLEQRPERIDRLERLKVFIYEKIVEKRTAGLLDRIEFLKYYINYPYKFGITRFDELEDILAQEPNPTKRKFIYNSNVRLLEDLQKTNLKLLRERKAIILDSLHFKSYNQFASMVRQEDITTFYQLVNNFLTTTNNYYYEQLYELLRNQKFAPEKLNSFDLPFLFNNVKFEKSFKKDSLKNFYLNLFYQMNFYLDSLPNLQINFIDLKKGKSQTQRFLETKGFEISIPNENILIVNNAGGSKNYLNLFYQTGRLFPSIYCDEDIFEFKYFGGDIIPLTFANLFKNIFYESEFLNPRFFHSDRLTSDFLKIHSFKKLYYIRKLCADFLVEHMMIDSIQTDPDSLVKVYNTILGYNLTNGDKLRLFQTINDYYYEMEILNSIFIDAMMRTRIREKFGSNWFEKPDLSDYLIRFIRRGKFLTKDKFLAQIGYYYLDPRFCFNELIAMNEKSKSLR